MRPAAQRRAEHDMTAEERSTLDACNAHLVRDGSDAIDIHDLRKWLSVPEDERDRVLSDSKRVGESEIAREVSQRTGLPVWRVYQLSRLL